MPHEELIENTIANLLTLAASNINLKKDIRDFVDAYLGDRMFRVAVDLGCGAGFYSRMLKKHSMKLIGIDLDLNSLESAAGYDIVYLADIRDFDKYVDDYDAIFLFDVIEHLEKNDGLTLLKKAIDKKAFIAIATPSKFSNSVQEIFTDFEPHKHKSVWAIKDLQSLGFKIWLFSREGYWGEKYGHHIVAIFDFNQQGL
jgi:predicted TPR repeat methyltransferase